VPATAAAFAADMLWLTWGASSPGCAGAMDREEVKIAVIGDPGVGKTSLITAAATETFPDHPPPVLPPTRLSADSTPEGVPILIIDTLSRPEDRPALEAACTQADVIVLAFDTGAARRRRPARCQSS